MGVYNKYPFTGPSDQVLCCMYKEAKLRQNSITESVLISPQEKFLRISSVECYTKKIKNKSTFWKFSVTKKTVKKGQLYDAHACTQNTTKSLLLGKN